MGILEDREPIADLRSRQVGLEHAHGAEPRASSVHERAIFSEIAGVLARALRSVPADLGNSLTPVEQWHHEIVVDHEERGHRLGRLRVRLFHGVTDGRPRPSGTRLGVAGGLILLYVRGINLSVSAAVGFISLFGVAVMSGLLYVADINARRRTPGLSLREAVVQGARVQFRPRLVLIVVTVLGMLPAALARGIGSDIQHPLATVVVGGLLATLILTLFALPAIYVLADRLRAPQRQVTEAD